MVPLQCERQKLYDTRITKLQPTIANQGANYVID